MFAVPVVVVKRCGGALIAGWVGEDVWIKQSPDGAGLEVGASFACLQSCPVLGMCADGKLLLYLIR